MDILRKDSLATIPPLVKLIDTVTFYWWRCEAEGITCGGIWRYRFAEYTQPAFRLDDKGKIS